MARPTCQLNLTLDVPTAERVEEIAFAAHMRPSGTGRDLLLERLALVDAGWALGDEETLQDITEFLGKKGSRKKK